MSKIKKYIEEIVRIGDNEDMEELSCMLEDAIHEIKKYDYDKYCDYKDELYVLAYGYHINDEMAEEIVERIGKHWTKEQTNQVKRQYGYSIDDNDFYVVMNMAYSDYHSVFGDNVDTYAKFSNAFINDDDAREGKVYYYFQYIPEKD